MRELVLLRHADAVPAGESTGDFERPLSVRGNAEAVEAARCIAAAELPIDALLVSPAQRARATAIIVAAQLDLIAPMRFEPELYEATGASLWEPLRRSAPESRCVLVVGHNPALSQLARACRGGEQPLELHTGGVCRIEFEDQTSWAALRPQFATACSMLR